MAVIALRIAVDRLANQAFEIAAVLVANPPKHILGQDVRRDCRVEFQPLFIGQGPHGLAIGHHRVIDHDIDLTEYQDQRSDLIGHPLIDRASLAVDRIPERNQIIGAFTLDLGFVECRRVDVGGFTHEIGDWRPGSAKLEIILTGTR